MKKITLLIVCSFIVAVAGARTITPQPVAPCQQEMFDVLKTWCDAMIDEQTTSRNEALDGGIVCPACARVHGRVADMIFPLFYVANHTGDVKYINAAKKLFKWSINNVAMADGSWSNDVNVVEWKGTTLFGLCSLAQTIDRFGHLIDPNTLTAWREEMIRQADFVVSYIKPGTGNINYPVSACYTLALVGKVSGDKKYTDRAAKLYADIKEHFTPNEQLLYGEGKFPYTKSEKGLLPVDIGYNLLESLPYLASYAHLTNNTELMDKVARSTLSHLEFMLPDGAVDNSWGTRNYKWSYWGARTCDGLAPLCAIIAPYSTVFAEAAYRNFQLLRSATTDGLLAGGMHYVSAGYRPCNHHTFSNAKGLADALSLGLEVPTSRCELPRDKEYGAKYIKDVASWLVSSGDWRATITEYDVEYNHKGGHVSGGALSMLWNTKTGPVLAAAMSQYALVEAANMQMHRGRAQIPLALRVEMSHGNVRFSNINDKRATVVHSDVAGRHLFTVRTRLVDINSDQPACGEIPVEIKYTFDKNRVQIEVVNTSKQPVRLVVPIISNSKEQYLVHKDSYIVDKGMAKIKVCSNLPVGIDKTEKNGRIFEPVAGFEAIPFYIDVSRDAIFAIEITN